MKTTDNNNGSLSISKEDYDILAPIANRKVSDILEEEGENVLFFSRNLQGIGNDSVICSTYQEEGEYKLKTGCIMGFIGRGETELRIKSRFDKGENDYFLFYMLLRACFPNVTHWDVKSGASDVLDMLAILFPMKLKKALKQGAYKEYRSFQHNDARVKGTIDVARHIRYNVPFQGKIAYNTHEFSYDNPITQLVRHTIEHIRNNSMFKSVLTADEETRKGVGQIVSQTGSYNKMELQRVLRDTQKAVRNPLYSDYEELRKICRAILMHERNGYGANDDKIHGILFDGAWLWEEYVAVVLKDRFKHYTNERKDFYLFKENKQWIIPDYLDNKNGIVGDAKYISLDNAINRTDESVKDIYYKTVMYMLRFNSSKGMLFYPSEEKKERVTLEIDKAGAFGEVNIDKYVYQIPMYVPKSEGEMDFREYQEEMKKSEKMFKEMI